jgi:transmembrane sensor
VIAANASSERLLAWTSGALLFDQTPLPIALREFERWYGVAVSIGDSALLTKRISARFQRESAETALDALAIAVHARVERRDSGYVLVTERAP